MENWLFTHFLSDLPGPLSYPALDNNSIFLQQSFRFRGGGVNLPLPPAGAPGKILQEFENFPGFFSIFPGPLKALSSSYPEIKISQLKDFQM